jgi:hypothetical protein
VVLREIRGRGGVCGGRHGGVFRKYKFLVGTYRPTPSESTPWPAA